jgi:hypothetical protein
LPKEETLQPSSSLSSLDELERVSVCVWMVC